MFTDGEKRFLKANELCRMATVSEDGSPHLVPVCYIFKDDAFYIVSDPETMKVKNLRRDGRVALLVDHYKPNRAVLVFGMAELINRGEVFREVSQDFFKRYSWARRDKWDEGEVALIKVLPSRKISWGFRKVQRS
jgi:PPOX class probable F420-dependent enzyme